MAIMFGLGGAMVPKIVEIIHVGGPDAAPTSLSATADTTAQQIKVTWTDNSTNEDGYKLERSPDAGSTWNEIAWLGAGVELYVDRNVDRGSTYHYRVRAYNSSGNSSYSNTDSDTVYAVTDETNVELYLYGDVGVLDGVGGNEITVDEVAVWEDQSGQGNDFSQSTAASQPYKNLYIDANRSAVNFDGVDELLVAASNFLSATDGIVSAVYYMDALDNGGTPRQVILSSSDEATNDYIWSLYAIDWYDTAARRRMGVGQTDNDAWSIIDGDDLPEADKLYLDVWRSDGASYELRKNRHTQSLTEVMGSNNGDWLGDTSNRDNFAIGADKYSVENRFFYGKLAALLMMSANPSDAVRDRIEKFFANEYWRRTETFMDEEYVGSYSGVTWSVNKPTKYGSNPIFGDGSGGSETWDMDKNWVKVIKVDDTFKMWYVSWDDVGDGPRTCYAESDDGITWTKPNLGLVTYDGNTDNNICSQAAIIDVYYDPDGAAGEEYVGVAWLNTSGTSGVFIYTSSDGKTWTETKEITTSTSYGETIEGKGIVKRPDGRWFVYYNKGHNDSPEDREIGLYFTFNGTGDLSGTWYDFGIIIESSSADDQKYGCDPIWYGNNGMTYLVVHDYNKTSEQIHANLYSARGGHSPETLESDGWIPVGSSGEWDDEWVLSAGSFVRVGDEWYIYYSGSPEDHAASLPRGTRIGLATIGFERIGEVADSGTGGTLTTDLFLPGAPLYVNVDASGGNKLEVELLDTDGNPITNYTQTDCDDITVDTYEQEVTWGGNSILTDRELQIKFYLDGATLYSYHV